MRSWCFALLVSCVVVSAAQAQPSDSSPRPRGYVVDSGRCMAPFGTDEASASLPAGVRYVEGVANENRLEIRDPSDAGRRLLLDWLATQQRPRRRFITLPLSDHGQSIGWAAFCVVAQPFIEANEIVFRDSTEFSNGTILVNSTLDDRARARLLETVGRTVIFLFPGDSLAGLYTIAALLDRATITLRGQP